MLKGYERFLLIRDLAQGELTHEDLSSKYGIDVNGVRGFEKRNSGAIRLAKQDFEDQYAGLWSASKELRIAEYQMDVEELDEILARQYEEGKVNEKLIVRKQHALRMIAEELGQIKSANDHSVAVTYEVVGVDPSDVT